MGDRLDWVREQAQEFCGKLGVEPPKLVVRETDVMGFRPAVHCATHDIVSFKKAVPLPAPELRVSPEALVDMDDRNLRFRIALAVLAYKRGGQMNAKSESTFAWAIAVIAAAPVFGAMHGWVKTWLAVVAVAACMAVYVIVSVVPVWRRTRNLHLCAAELTGDPDTAIEHLSGRHQVPPWAAQLGRGKQDRRALGEIAAIRKRFGQ